MKRLTQLLVMSGLLGIVACGDDDGTTNDAGMNDDAMVEADVPVLDGAALDAPTTDGGVDPCMGVAPADRCDTAGTSCDGDTLSTCADNGSGCLVITETDCTTDGGTCDDSGAMAMCSTDPCMGVTDCAEEGSSCESGSLVECTANADGCLVTTTTDCGADGNLCGGDPLACYAPDCSTEMVIDCDTGTIMGNTDGGPTNFSNYCGRSFTYDSPENVYTFLDSRNAIVTISTERMGSTHDMDLIVMNGGDGTETCTDDLECLGSSTTTNAIEEVTFNHAGGSLAYVVYDAFGAGVTDRVTEYSLTVSCEIVVCGDGMVVGAESCDDGNTTDGDGCSASCEVETGYMCDDAEPSVCTLSCGDGVINGTDTCDDGNTTAGDGCSDLCQLEMGYFCDDAEPQVCMLSCGDSIINGMDTCDDGNDMAGDGCDAMCQTEDGYQCTGEPSTCVQICGNGELDTGERCDDGNSTAGDGCDATCQVEDGFGCVGEPSYCGAAIAAHRMGDLDDTDMTWVRASASCGSRTASEGPYEAYEYTNSSGAAQVVDIGATFGDFDGYIHVFTGAFDPTMPTANCGDGDDDFDGRNSSLIEGFTVEDGATITIVVSPFNATGEGTFSSAVFLSPLGCGDGAIQSVFSEACDDGNTTDGDGCSASCEIEDGFSCGGEPSMCAAVGCPNGFVDGADECDDNNATNGDGCSDACIIEDGYVCAGEPSMCEVACGNGAIDAGEDCDDDNTANGDGCSDACEVEAGFVCEGEPSVCAEPVCGNGMVEPSELCDDGNTTDGDGCEGDCLTAVFSGSLEDTDPTWARPSSFCSSGSAGKHYDTQAFAWNGAASESIRFEVAWTGVDGFLHVFDQPFDASMPTTNCRGGGDDFGGTSGSAYTTTMAAGETVEAIMSTFDPGDTGDWTLTVSFAP